MSEGQVCAFYGGPLDGTSRVVPTNTHWYKVLVTEYLNLWYPPEAATTAEVVVREDVYERISITSFQWRYRR